VAQVVRDVPDLRFILDLGLPGQDGLSICRQIASDIPESDPDIDGRATTISTTYSALELGADDYVIKTGGRPRRVLMARINALLRRSKGPGRPPSPKTLRFWPIAGQHPSLVRSVWTVKSIALSSAEFDLLVCLAGACGERLSRARAPISTNSTNVNTMASDRMLDVRISQSTQETRRRRR